MSLRLFLIAAAVLIGCGMQQARTDGPAFDEHRIDVGAAPGSVLALDANDDGILDLAVANLGDGTIDLLTGDGTGEFSRRATLEAGEQPEDLAAGDFDGDGRTDLLVANHETDHVTVLFGDGEGFERREQSRVTVSVSPHPHRVSVGDFDGDGHLDFLVDDPSAEALRVFRGRGDGTFVEGERIALAGNPFYGMAVADFDGDGHLDVATPYGIARGDGAGGFTAEPELPDPGPPPYSVAVADVNGDGVPDLGVGSGQQNEGAFAVWLGSVDGTLTPDPASPFSVPPGPTSVAVSDVDGNGIEDFVVTSYAGNGLTIVLGGRQGLRTVRRDVEENPWAVATGDFDRDGRTDLVTANSGSDDVSVLLARVE